MERSDTRKYESIEALIMAAEVLEREELIAKEHLLVQNISKIPNYDITNVDVKDIMLGKCTFVQSRNEENQNANIRNDLLHTIDYIKDLKTSEMWSDLFDGKHKYHNQKLCCELNDLKKKISEMKGITPNVDHLVPVLAQDENEDTPTASEDEGYNKYNEKSLNNFDDNTDDASECEETLKMPYKSNFTSKMIKNKRIKAKTLMRTDKLSNMPCNISRNIGRKRRGSNNIDTVTASSKIRSCQFCNPSMTLISRKFNNVDCISTPFDYLHYSSDLKSVLKIHQAVDI